MHHIIQSGMNFEPCLAHRYMNCIKEAVKAGIWNGICPQWFMLKDDVPLNPEEKPVKTGQLLASQE
jgi:hypothetical protein